MFFIITCVIKFLSLKFGLSGHDFINLPLADAYVKNHNFDIVCLPETFLDLTVPVIDGNSGYSLLRAYHPIKHQIRKRKCFHIFQSV